MTTIESFRPDEILLIIGDFLIDKTYLAQASRLSPEAPVPIANILGSCLSPGGAGLGAAYAKKHKIENFLLSALSFPAEIILMNKNMDYINVCGTKNNIEKIRYVDVSSGYQLLRADTDLIVEKPKLYILNLLDTITILSKRYKIKAVVCLDYIKGFLNRDSRKELIKYCVLNSLPVYVDSKQDQSDYSGSSIVKFNSKELDLFLKEQNLSSIAEACSFLKANSVIETKGDSGAEIFISNLGSYFYKTKKSFGGIPNVSGCGDVFDISFCNNFYILGQDPIKAFKNAVDSATLYAYSPVDERL